MQQLIDSEGWRTTYLVIGLLCVVTMIPLALLLRGNPPEQTDATSADETIGRSRPAASGFSPTGLQLLLTVAGISCCVAMAMPQVHLVAYCVDLGYGPAVGAEMLSVMLDKGLVSRDETNRPLVYRASVTRNRAQQQMVKGLIQKAFDGSTSSLVMQALSSQKASKQELAEIRELIEKLEGENS